MTIRIAALAAAVLACATSTAQAETREPVVARVSYAGLDLASEEGRRILDARIDAAARRACVSPGFGMRGAVDVRRCRAEMRRDGQVRVANLARPTRVASTR